MQKNISIMALACIWLLMLGGSCRKEVQMDFSNWDIQGHRGCRGLMPENTIAGMIRAMQLRVNTLEMDALITKDKQVILSHEPYFSHLITTLPNGKYIAAAKEQSYNIYQMTYDSVVQYDVGLKPNPDFPRQQKMKAVKPRLSDVIDSVQHYARAHSLPLPWVSIETKSTAATDNLFHPAPKEFVDLLLAVIDEKHVADSVIIESFDIRTLQYLHSIRPEIKTSLCIDANDKRTLAEQLKQLGFTPYIYTPLYPTVSSQLINDCRQAGVKLIPAVVNSQDAIEAMWKAGIDGVITDYPNVFR